VEIGFLTTFEKYLRKSSKAREKSKIFNNNNKKKKFLKITIQMMP